MALRSKRSLDPSEEQIQAAFVEWVRLNTPRFPKLELLFHPANGGQRHAAVARKLKAAGVRPGVPDIMLPVVNAHFVGCAIEFKSATGKLSPHQKDYINLLRQENWFVEVCHSVDEAIFVIEQYFRSIPRL